MPRIELVEVPLYNPDDPYHFHVDNLPLQSLIKRLDLVNFAVDNANNVLRDAQGTQGTLSNRLNQSIDSDGNLKESAVDETLHNIGSHTDGSYLGVDYVRMTLDERTKLTGIQDEATSLYLKVQNGLSEVTFDAGELKLQNSSTLTWEVTSPNIVQGHLAFDPAAAHQHSYDITPSTSDYTNFVTPYAFIEDSLRVYINGIRISQSEEVYVPGALMSSPWTLISFTVDDSGDGTFHLSTAISSDDIIRVDFDVSLS